MSLCWLKLYGKAKFLLQCQNILNLKLFYSFWFKVAVFAQLLIAFSVLRLSYMLTW